MYWVCPRCVETRVHQQPFHDTLGRFICGACWFLDGEEVEMAPSRNQFELEPFDANAQDG